MIFTRKTKPYTALFLSFIFIVIISEWAVAQEKQTGSAVEYYNRISGNPNLETNPKGESFCWHAAAGIHTFVDMYEATQDKAWIEYGIKYYDYLVESLDTGPDGYKGWIGPYMYDTKYWCDVHVGDAILWRGILDFSVLILHDNSLKEEYGAKALVYSDLAAKHCIEKWDKRGTWHEDGPAGVYVSYSKYLEPGDLTEWRYGAEVKGSNLSLPFNKQNDMAQVCMRLYRISGEEFYREKAEKIFFRMKRSFQFFDNHYVWNYWEPFGQWDIDRENNKPRHWVGVHPYRNYQAGEIVQIVDAYHTGLVFDELDIKRIINTNLDVMWNGDKVKPAFSNSNITHVPKKKLTPGSGYPSLAGTLWTALLDFSQTVRDLHSLKFKADEQKSLSQVYFENVVAVTTPGFSRKYTDTASQIPSVDFTECPWLNMAVVMPQSFSSGEETLIISKAWAGEGNLEIALYSQDGDEKICVLDRRQLEGGGDGLAGIRIFPWDGSDPDGTWKFKGDFRIRWTFIEGYREFPITIQ